MEQGGSDSLDRGLVLVRLMERQRYRPAHAHGSQGLWDLAPGNEGRLQWRREEDRRTARDKTNGFLPPENGSHWWRLLLQKAAPGACSSAGPWLIPDSFGWSRRHKRDVLWQDVL